jgi:hypothetical protein
MKFKKLRDKIKGRTADGSVPADQKLYSRIKNEAKKKFGDDYPSAYSSAWLVGEFKRRGGKYKK